MIGQKVTGKQGRSFTIVREIGRGGFGVVFLAEDEKKHPFAVKVIAPVSDPVVRLSFEQEIQSTLGLTHENLLWSRMETLRKRHVVHGGYIEIKEGREDREGWNLVLVRPSESLYGEWKIVESRVSPLVPYASRYEPIAAEARLFADNLACHWMPATHTWVLKDKLLERSDIVRILNVFIPKD